MPTTRPTCDLAIRSLSRSTWTIHLNMFRNRVLLRRGAPRAASRLTDRCLVVCQPSLDPLSHPAGRGVRACTCRAVLLGCAFSDRQRAAAEATASAEVTHAHHEGIAGAVAAAV